MIFKQFYLSCLAHASYLVGSDGAAAVVDPQRDVDVYIDEAAANNLQIKYVFETHLHADFVSGHLELGARTGAQIVVSRQARAAYAHFAVDDADEINLGNVRIRVLATPGHTPESISLLVSEKESDEPPKILTGDTLFVGDVGRPDLVGADGYTASAMAAMLYESLHEKLLPLDDATEVYPAHGAGSLCGRNISKDNSSTIGRERAGNYALQPMAKADFVELLTANLPEIPHYFPFDRKINRNGARALGEIPAPPAMTAETVKNLLDNDDYILLDAREGAVSSRACIAGSINIGLRGQFATWAGSLISNDKRIVIVASNNAEVSEAVMRLARIGLENVAGYLEGGIESWKKVGFQTNEINQISAAELREQLKSEKDLQILDVRKPEEYAAGHVPSARNTPLIDLHKLAAAFDLSRPTIVICAGGYRSSAAAGVLARAGFAKIYNLAGGTDGWVRANYEVETNNG